jgi:exosortase
LLLLSIILWYELEARLSALNEVDRLSVSALLIVLAWIATFILFYGLSALKAAAFPLMFLLLMSPLPQVLTEHLVSILQKGSAETCYALFRITGVPVVRRDFLFSLPGVDIEVAEECSGIHAGLSLFIVGLLALSVLSRSNPTLPSRNDSRRL